MGKVLDPDGIGLPGAAVTSSCDERAEVRTDDEGAFVLELPAGTCTLYVERDGFGLEVVENVRVVAGAEARADVALFLANGSGEIEVVGEAQAGGTAAYLTERQESATVADVLAAEQMSQAGDSDAAAALKRVTGLSVVGSRYVYVRGLGDRYAATLLNGATLPSPEPEKRVVPLDLFPTALLEGVVVQKAASPDLPGEFGGGVLLLRTKGLPEGPTFSASLSGAWDAGTTLTRAVALESEGTDWLGFGTASRALPEDIASSEGALKQEGMFSDAGFSVAELESMGELFDGDWGGTERTLPPDFGLNLSAGHRVNVGAGKAGGYVGLVYGNGWDVEEGYKNAYSAAKDGVTLKRSATFTEVQNGIRLGGLAMLGAEWGQDAHVTNTFLLNRTSDATAIAYEADDPSSAADSRSYRTSWEESQLLYDQASARIVVGPLRIEPRYAFALASRDEPDRREYTYDYSDGGWLLSQRGSWNEIRYTTLRDHSHEAALALGLPLGRVTVGGDPVPWIRAGGLASWRERTSSTRRFSFEYVDSTLVDRTADIETVITPENIGSALQLEEYTANTDDYTANQQIAAGWLLADVPWTRRLRTMAGARVERSRQSVSTFEAYDDALAPITSELASVDVLPSATLSYGIGPASEPDRMLLRLGYGRTVSRPEFRELSEVPYYDYRTGRLFFGNPDLERALIDSVDARWEWYSRPGQSLSLGAYFKHFQDPIEAVVEVSAVSGSVGTFANAKAATNVGVEADFRQSLDVVPALAPLYVAGNVAWIWSRVDLAGAEGNQTSTERPLQGQSPYVVNLQLGAEVKQLDVSLLYNVQGPRIVEVGTSGIPDTYELPVHRLDLVGTQGIGERWKIRLRAQNLLDWPRRERVGDEIAEETRAGWSVGVGVSWAS